MKPINDQILDIASDRVSGASELALKSLEVLKSAYTTVKATDTENYLSQMNLIADALSNCRPAMAPIKNSVDKFRKWLNSTEKNDTVESLKRRCGSVLSDIAQTLILNKERCISNAAAFIGNQSVILTCSCSSTLQMTLHKAADLGKKLTLRILKSQLGEISYGARTISRLEPFGIACSLLDDNIPEQAFDGADMVMLSADTVSADGSAVNGYPSLKLAEAAFAYTPPIPVYIISDSSKFCLCPDAQKPEEGFDLIPGRLITGLITEDGLYKRHEIITYLKSRMR